MPPAPRPAPRLSVAGSVAAGNAHASLYSPARAGLARADRAREEGGVAAEPLGGHDRVGAGRIQAGPHVEVVVDVAVGDHRHRHVLLHRANHSPVRRRRAGALVFARPSMYGQHLRARVHAHLGVLQRLRRVGEDPDLSGDRDVARRVHAGDQRVHEREVVHQEGAVVAALGDPLRAPGSQAPPQGEREGADAAGGCEWLQGRAPEVEVNRVAACPISTG